MSVFWSNDRLLKPGLRRGICFIIFAGTFILTEMGRRIYRPYIYRAGINDLGLADMMGNLGGTGVQIYLYLGLANATPVQGFRIIAFVAAGYTLYEIVQPILPRGTLGPKDIAATLIASLLSAALFAAPTALFPDPKPSADDADFTDQIPYLLSPRRTGGTEHALSHVLSAANLALERSGSSECVPAPRSTLPPNLTRKQFSAIPSG